MFFDYLINQIKLIYIHLLKKLLNNHTLIKSLALLRNVKFKITTYHNNGESICYT